MTNPRNLWRRIRCAIRTAGLHEFEINSGLCMHCRARWRDVYRHKLQPMTPDERPAASPYRRKAWLPRLFRRRVRVL